MALELRNRCEDCGQALAPSSPAVICSYECTFCESCTSVMKRVCPNCGGELILRPK